MLYVLDEGMRFDRSAKHFALQKRLPFRDPHREIRQRRRDVFHLMQSRCTHEHHTGNVRSRFQGTFQLQRSIGLADGKTRLTKRLA